MQKYFLNNKIIFTSVFVLIVFSFANSISAVFFNPTSTPPNSNISSPINVGTDFQTKTGLIAVNGLRVLGPTILDQSFKLTQGASNGYVLTSDANGNASWQALGAGNGGVDWGEITGNINNQTDLINALNLKAPLDSPLFTGSLQAPTVASNDNSNKLATTAFVTTVAGLPSSGNNGWTDSGSVVSTFNQLDDILLGVNTSIKKNSNQLIYNPGTGNLLIGANSLNSSLTGSYNTGAGSSTLTSLTSGSHNSALGNYALWKSNTASYNTAIGYAALLYNYTGNNNTAIGTNTLLANPPGIDNTGVGMNSLYNTTGNNNTAIGASAFSDNTTGNNNTAIGYDAEVSTGTLTNAIAIGYGAIVDASNKIKIGNTSVTSIDLQVAYTSPSDLRLKENINDIDLGLEFIKKLRPVSYTLKGGKGIDYGFIAQEVENAIGKDTNLVLTDNTDFRGKTMRYTELIAPLTKAIQEQQEEIEGYRARLEILKERARILEEDLNN